MRSQRVEGGALGFPDVMFWSPELSNIGACQIGPGSVIHSHVWIGDGVVIGARCKVQAFAFLPPGVTLEDDVFVGPHVCFTNDRHPPSAVDAWEPTRVCRGAVIGAAAVILPGLTIGAGAFVAAGAVVTRDVPPQCVVAGVPARLMREQSYATR